MRISHKHKFIFIHIPRNAGRSIIVALKEKYPDVRRLAWSHARLKDVRRKVKLRNYWKVAVVRNPYERMVSLYCFLKQKKRFYETRKGKMKESKDMPEFTEWLLNLGKKSHNIRTSDTPQYDWIRGYKVKIIRYENLVKDVKKIFGIKLTMTHKTKHKHYRDYYDERSKAYIERVFKKDLKVFGYEF